MISFRTTIHLNLSLESRYHRRIVFEKSKLSVTSRCETYSIETSSEICIRESLKRSYKIHQNPLFRSSYFFITVLHVTSCGSKFFQAFTYKQNSVYAHTHRALTKLYMGKESSCAALEVWKPLVKYLNSECLEFGDCAGTYFCNTSLCFSSRWGKYS